MALLDFAICLKYFTIVNATLYIHCGISAYVLYKADMDVLKCTKDDSLHNSIDCYQFIAMMVVALQI